MSLTPLAQIIKDSFDPKVNKDVIDSVSHDGEHVQSEVDYLDFKAQIPQESFVERLSGSWEFSNKLINSVVESLQEIASEKQIRKIEDMDDSVYEKAAQELIDRLRF